MASPLRLFSNQLNPNRQVPLGPVAIDWSNPLADGLIGCWLPGASGVDIAGKAPTLAYGAGAIVQATPEGPGEGVTTSASNTGMTAIVGAPFTNYTALTIYWRGLIAVTGSTQY